MLKSLCILIAVAMTVTGSSEHFYAYSATLQDYNFTTPLNHFRPQETRFVNFTYKLNLAHYNPGGGPIFIYVSGGGFDYQWIRTGLMVDIAAELGAALATADHRYHGVNIPTPSADFDDLQYLTIEQALDDLAHLIRKIHSALGEQRRRRVILWGNGYGAALAVNARQKYPHLVDGVWASSAYFLEHAMDSGFYDTLSSIIREHGGAVCAERVQIAFTTFNDLIATSEPNILKARLRLCEPLNVEDPQEVAHVMQSMIQLIGDYISTAGLNGIQNFCQNISAIPLDPLQSFINWRAYVRGSDCITARYETLLRLLQVTNWTEFTGWSAAIRAVTFLHCTQRGGLKISVPSQLILFPTTWITADYKYQYCNDVIGARYNRALLVPAVANLNLNLGGRNDQRISRVVFTTAGLDPYRHHGITEYDRDTSAFVTMPYDVAGSDLRSQTDSDSAELRNGKLTIRERVMRWATG